MRRAVTGIGGRLGVAALVGLTACGPHCGGDASWVSGEVALGPGIEASAFRSLEIRVVAEHVVLDEHAPRPWPHDVPGESVPIQDVEFPYAFSIVDDDLGPHEYDLGIIAWLASDAAAPWPADDDPQAAETFVLCWCGSHTPAHADELALELVRP